MKNSHNLLIISITCLITISICCTSDANGLSRKEFDHNGIKREYIYYAPDNLSENAPLVVVLHGFTSSSDNIMEYSKFNELADENNFAIVYPQGTRDQKSNTFWNVGYDFHADVITNDLDFIAKLVTFLQSKYSLSQENTFATGMSNGAEMCYLLACNYPNIFNSVAPVAGTMMNNRFNHCNPSHPIPIFSIFGTDDKTTHYFGDEANADGWGAYKSVPSIIEFWTSNMNYSSIRVDTLPDISKKDSSYVLSKKYVAENSTTEFLYFEVVGGGHDWPGAWGNQDINASKEIWNFFKTHLIAMEPTE
ncbi:MAG: polyhydroxybutyrate depolymerase [Algoriphagus sp.]|jgi:polyhydroxybutyrate depolymerase